MSIKTAAAFRNALKVLQTGIQKHLAAGVDATLGQVEGLASPQKWGKVVKFVGIKAD